MARRPKKPVVAFDWTDRPEDRVERVRARCRLCGAVFYSYSRNGLYPTTSAHKRTCPKLVSWQDEMKRLGHDWW